MPVAGGCENFLQLPSPSGRLALIVMLVQAALGRQARNTFYQSRFSG